jgi:hypothetical protein
MLDANALKGLLKTDLIALYEDCNSDAGVSAEGFVDRMAGIISKVIPYIKENAGVTPGEDWLAGGQYPVKGTATGEVS